MGVRETLNKQPAITTGATIGIILLALIFIIYQVVGGGNHIKIPTKAYYTTDDGASYYKDDINLIAPYDYSGKQAVKADVFKCAGGSEFVGYLEKYSADAKKVLDDSRSHPGPADFGKTADAKARGLLVKAPLTGDNGWVKNYRPAAQKIVTVKCPGGVDQAPEPMLP
jgi:hypothetical protein